MKIKELTALFANDSRLLSLARQLEETTGHRVRLEGLMGSAAAMAVAALSEEAGSDHLLILPDKESAAYFLNDLESILAENNKEAAKKRVLFYPTIYKKPGAYDAPDNGYLQLRTEVISRINTTHRSTIILTYPEALCDKVINKAELQRQTLNLSVKEAVSLDFVADVLLDYQFERADFVYEPGQFALRGGILDVFAFSGEFPFRIEFLGNRVESIRTFDPSTQLSRDKLNSITILPDIQTQVKATEKTSFPDLLDPKTTVWINDVAFTRERLNAEFIRRKEIIDTSDDQDIMAIEAGLLSGDDLLGSLEDFNIIEFGRQFYFTSTCDFLFKQQPQPSINKNFDLLLARLKENIQDGLSNLIFTDNPKQAERLYAIFEDIQARSGKEQEIIFEIIPISIHEGFTDTGLGISCYTDHQIFDRYHRFRLRDQYASKEAITLKELYSLQPGDYVTHIDHGIGRFDGLEKIENNGKLQEAVRLIYKNNDLLYISIHSLHRISKYTGKEGAIPVLDKLGSSAWKNLKTKTKKRVKDIAKDLIKLYAQRRASTSYPFAPDTYLQNELEASFMYEDTPDQLKATVDVKKDLEQEFPMDRLICGDVGFGKTEIALRAAFKVVADSKQVALLVPTTILALQHYKTFSDRFRDFPCKVDYINRFKSTADQKKTLKALAEGHIDILIGTHRLLSQDVKFKDLGLLIIDEEQKFGVAAKEKLKSLKVNVDTLTLTATPIPRTMQFSLMGARDLSIINTPPPNRYPIQTELRPFGEEVIRDAIQYEVDRGGQVFFIHNRIQNIHDMAGMIRRFCPEVSVAVAHGQMEGAKLEKIMLDFIEGRHDVLLSTTIVESGLDISNANTIIINDAQHYGLSDLHQLRGRVGRSNRRAFCYLLAPPLSVLTEEARRRLKAIEEFSDLGSGFNIAMRDLDIRGAGNILGAEQSGFISEIGFEMYHKILDEAIQELKQEEFADLFNQQDQQTYVYDCQIETDLQLMIPDAYVSNTTERLSLYKELDGIESEQDLERFGHDLADRFGPLPEETSELIESVKLRWNAKALGFEKITLNNNALSGYFVSNQASPYFHTPTFTGMLKYIQNNPQRCNIRESKNKLRLGIRNVPSVRAALELIISMREFIDEIN